MHVSDLHPDLFYTVGAEANCTKKPVCCREENKNYTISEQYRKIMNREVTYANNNDE